MTKFGELTFGDLIDIRRFDIFGEMTTVGEMTSGDLTFGDLADIRQTDS